MTCDVDAQAEIEANVPITSLPPFSSIVQPPPFQCKPGEDPAGYWDEDTNTLNNDTFANSYGRENTEGW